MFFVRDISISIIISATLTGVLVLSAPADAQIRSSSNYQLESDSVNIGGGDAASASYSTESTVGEVATGRSASTNFSLQAGYQQLNEVFLSLSMDSFAVWGGGLEITIQSSEVDSTLTDFPVYVNLADLGPDFWSGVQSDGRDIRVTTADGVTEVPFELVSIDTSTDTGELHFKAPTISSSTDTSFFLYYDNPDATAYEANDTYGSQNVWTNGYVYVSHDGGATDSTANGNDGTAAGTLDSFGGSTNAQMGISSAFDGSGYIDLGDASELELDFTFSLQAWIRPTSSPSFSAFIATDDWEKQTSSYYGANLQIQPDRTISASVGDGTGSVSDDRRTAATTGTINNFEWSYVTANFTSLVGRQIYFDGVLQAATNSGSGSSLTYSAQSAYIGDLFNGYIDEVRMSSSTRTADWYKSEFSNQNLSTGFYATSSAGELLYRGSQSGFALSPALPGLTGGTSSGTATFTVTTDSPTGYEVTIQASDAPAMQSSNGATIANYNNGDTADFVFTIPAASAVFGFSPTGVDVADAFLDDTTTCGVGSSETAGACWAGVSTTPITIVESASPNQPDGATTSLLFQVGIASGGGVESGFYIATSTVTALPL